MIISALIKSAVGVAAVSALALSATTPVRAAPALSNTLAVKSAASNVPTQVRWYYRIPSYNYGYSPYYGYGSYYGYGYGYTPYYSYGYAPYGYGYSSYAYVPW